MTESTRTPIRLFGDGSLTEARRIGDILRRETIGGALLLAATVAALIWANSPVAGSYHALRDLRFGPHALHLHLDAVGWAADGLLAVFFFVAGLELKRELVAGDLRDWRRAAVPVAAAVGGVIAPALVYLLVSHRAAGAGSGWAVPTATDIAFALAVLAVVGRHLPAAMRTFLLTLAVVDDLLAIVIIAVGYTAHLEPVPLLLALAPLAGFAALLRRRVLSPWLLGPLAMVTWALVHTSGVHATVAGVALALAVPVLPRAGRAAAQPPGDVGLAEHLEHRFRPLSAGVAVPVFALLSAGVPVGDPAELSSALHDPVALGIVAGLVLGKPIGVVAATWLVARCVRAPIGDGLTWADVMGLAFLSGIGFTVSLLIGELAFGTDGQRIHHVTLATLAGSLAAGTLAAVILRLRNRAHRRLRAADPAGPVA